VAHFLEVVGEHSGEGVTVGYGIVIRLFFCLALMVSPIFFRRLWKDVKLIELRNRAVDYACVRVAASILKVKSETAVPGGIARSPKLATLGGIAVFHFQLAKGGCIVAPPLDEKFEMERFALDDLEEVKNRLSCGGTASHSPPTCWDRTYGGKRPAERGHHC